ncbi:Scr1 family TA system antitoxin-like transcriptional regulator [Nocardia sp. R6R-6]|uniref:Scr1 family TA system antitoxin-like transcriptional regulator n=1 Tax=Nocardia sp. R6R-6 TaxID=3459303 RepID=UPI00403DDF0D
MTDQDHDNTTLPRRQLGQYLREARSASNLTLDQVAPMMQWSTSKLQRVEKGQSPKVRELDVEALCRIYDIDSDLMAALKGLAAQASVKSWWHAFDDLLLGNFELYVGLESSAQQLSCYRPDIISGLFQTPDYARALDRNFFPGISDEELNRRIELRTKRQALITRKTQPAKVDVIFNEACLRYVVGGPSVMSAQATHLANLPASVRVRIQPFTAGFPLGIAPGPFTLLDFGQDAKGRPNAPSVVYVESYGGDMYLERVKDLDRYRQAFETIQQTTLDVASSKALLRRVAREYAA